jgi:hypothetical protein
MVDASMFKVLPGDNRVATGTVDFLMQAHTEIVQEDNVVIVKASA